jgi:anti-sigma-K factor RskA
VSHEPYETLVAVYAVGALDGDDLVQFEAHLPTCAACQAALRDAHDTLAKAMLSAPPQIPPAGVREALVRRVGGGGTARRGWLRWAAGTAVAAAAAAGFVGTWVAVRYEARLGQMARETAAVKERLARNEAALREQVALYRGAVELLRDPATRVVELRGQGPASAASGRMIWNDAGGGHLFVAGLPQVPAGKTYELWTIAGKTPKPAGLFGVDDAGRGTHRVPADAGAGAGQVFAVTLEPEGGTPAPTGPIVLASK